MKGTCSSTSSSLLLRNRRVENLEMSCFGSSKTSVSSVFNGGKSAEIERDYRNGDGCSSSFDDSRDGWADGDGWGAVVVSIVRIVTCFVTMMFTTFFWGVLMVLLLPWPYARIRQGNVYGHVTGRLLMWILGNPIKIEGAEFSNTRGIYICNHASPLDIFLIMWLTPTGTVGIAKKEIIYYPLFGQLYVLANHLRIDRSNPVAAIESMKEVARAIVKKNLSLVLFPEGTRSKTGRLLPFKKGFVHIALQSRLPIVPIVLTGTHLAWRKNSLHVRPAPLTVKFLPPIKTNDWMAENIDGHVKMVYDLFIKNLPERQRPVMVEELDDLSRKKPS